MFKRLLTLVAALALISFASAQLQSGSSWPKVDGNAYNQNAGLGPGIASPYTKWRWGGLADSCSPGVISANGTVYFGDFNNSNNYLVPVNSTTGAQKWKFAVPNFVLNAPAIGADGTVYVGCSNGKLYAITDNGTFATEKWAYQAAQTIAAPTISVSNGLPLIIFGSTDGTVYEIVDHGTSASLESVFNTDASVVTSPLLSPDPIIGSQDGNFYNVTTGVSGMDAASVADAVYFDDPSLPGGYGLPLVLLTGFQIEACGNSDPSDVLSSLLGWIPPGTPSTPAVLPGTGLFYVPSLQTGGNDVLAGNAFGLANGGGPENKWVFTADWISNEPTAMVASDGTIYFASDKLYCLTDNGSTYTKNWTFPVFPNGPMAMDASGVLYMQDAAYGGFTAIAPISLEQTRLEPTSVQGGQRAAVAFYLNAPVEAGGITVKVASSSADAVMASNTISIPAGADAGNVLIHTYPVSSPEAINITGTYNGVTLHRTLTLEPAALTGIRVAPTALQGGVTGALAIYLNGEAGATGDTVSLLSSSTDVTVPTSVAVRSSATDANVPVHTAYVSSLEQVTLSATFGSNTLHTTITLNPPVLSGINVTAPGSVISGFPTQLAVYLNGRTGSGGMTVTLLSSSADVTLPSTVTIPQGSGSANVVVHTAAVNASESITISATLGSTTLHTNLLLMPAAPRGISVAPSTVFPVCSN